MPRFTTLQNMTLTLVLTSMFALTAYAETQAVETDTPLAVITETVNGVIAVLRNKTLSDDRRERQVNAIIARRFDYTAMANRVLATNWRKASKEQRVRFTRLFRELLSNTYWQKLSGYENETVEFVGERRNSDKLATVMTLIKTDTVEIPVDYKLYRSAVGWAAYDVVIEQISLVRNYRSSFQDIVRADGIDGLISQLEVKVAESSGADQ